MARMNSYKGDYVLEVEGDYVYQDSQEPKNTSRCKRRKQAVEIVRKRFLGSHAFDVRQSVKGRVGSAKDGARDFDVTIGGNETRIVGGNFDLKCHKESYRNIFGRYIDKCQEQYVIENNNRYCCDWFW